MTERIWREERDGDLRPCPFCGGTDLMVVPDPEDKRDSMVLCRSCGASGCPAYHSNDAREHWNRRAERTCRWVWAESWSDDVLGRECDYANWVLDCGCWDGCESDLGDFDRIDKKPAGWDFCPRCGAKVVDEQRAAPTSPSAAGEPENGPSTSWWATMRFERLQGDTCRSGRAGTFPSTGKT